MDYERFAPLVTPHTATITRIAAALVGLADAEDTAQEALLRAWRAWPTLREVDSTRAWLMQITVNVCRTWRARSLGLRQGLGARDRLQTVVPSEDIPAATLGTTDHINALDLRQALLTLGADLRQVIVLRFYVGMDSTEIGDLLSEPPATVRSRLRRAVIQLRGALDDGRQATPATPTTPASAMHARKDA
jgi:RNA polymerase sigma-70 factor, ECF subfamily